MDYPFVPLINWARLTDEQPVARHISQQLTRVLLHATLFEQAVALVDHCQELKAQHLALPKDEQDWRIEVRYGDWMTIAARDAAFSVYHFQSVIRSIRDQLHRAPSIASKVDTKALNAAYERIDDEFPGWKSLRNAVGHWADMAFQHEQQEAHKIPDGIWIQSAFDGKNRRLIMTRDQKHQTLDVTHESLEKLVSIIRDVYAAFEKAALRSPQPGTFRPTSSGPSPSPE